MKSKAEIIEEYAQAVASRVTADSIEAVRQTLQQWREARIVKYRTTLCIQHTHCSMCLRYLFEPCRMCPMGAEGGCRRFLGNLAGDYRLVQVYATFVSIWGRSRSTGYRYRRNVIRTLERIIKLYQARQAVEGRIRKDGEA